MAPTNAGVILGTAAYMSPEQAKGRPVDRRTDIWAFGCVLYEMLTGRQAFDGDDVTEILAAVVRSEPDWSRLPETMPATVHALLRKCLRKDRALRIVQTMPRFAFPTPSKRHLMQKTTWHTRSVLGFRHLQQSCPLVVVRIGRLIVD